MKDYEINPHILNWIHAFLSDLTSVLRGSKLGPRLFLVIINDSEIKSLNGNAIFVNDTTSFEIVKNNQESTAQVIVNEIADWSIQNKLQVQPRKCKELRISFKHAPSVLRDLYTNDTPIETMESFQVLGLTIQGNLKWDQEVEKI